MPVGSRATEESALRTYLDGVIGNRHRNRGSDEMRLNACWVDRDAAIHARFWARDRLSALHVEAEEVFDADAAATAIEDALWARYQGTASGANRNGVLGSLNCGEVFEALFAHLLAVEAALAG
ncbi:MAG: hypothetical protein H6721_12365 [Sandaracinus sp.]|nr:hypothetical protein [Sandaracinus sp.]